jgi:hypothetical protein
MRQFKSCVKAVKELPRRGKFTYLKSGRAPLFVPVPSSSPRYIIDKLSYGSLDARAATTLCFSA